MNSRKRASDGVSANAQLLGVAMGTRGFTLIELLVVIAIIAVLAAIWYDGCYPWCFRPDNE